MNQYDRTVDYYDKQSEERQRYWKEGLYKYLEVLKRIVSASRDQRLSTSDLVQRLNDIEQSRSRPKYFF